ncbi:Inhibitor of nuclear factor kappa-B kinase-interacting protein [Dissostichus eleginoides]|uniref:Inhibitor of nuclear factor kappa-B kinase-interacting protein n=1 Tax=Dissostichus eleginoides TaxID=100907 RepID=A0AAD9FKM1_DISEL|nr:Inhibitor of nuclear factor kappa-B kinase-interacting protein [Dissostichus eleginoides]
MEEEVLKVSEKLAASEDDLQEALSTVSLATRLQQDISTLHAAVTVMQNDENSASRDLQTVSGHFLNVTETWQVRLATIASDLTALKSESREAHAGATERVNEAEQQARSLAEKLEELEDSTKRNARAMERTEGDDTKRSQEHLDWNTKQIHHLEEKISSLTKREAELDTQLQEHIPRAKECEQHLPQVENAVRSILRLAGDLSGAEKRLEEVTLQVFGTEDSMLKALGEILEIRQELDTLQAQNSILKMKNELSVVKEAVHELTMCESVQLMLQGLEGQRGAPGPQLEGLQQDVSRLQEWSSGLNEKRAQLQGSLSSLRDAVGQIEERTSAIAKDFVNKVASVRTDVRRMEGLRSELESLLTQVTELEDKTSQVEHSMVKSIGDVLANSIDRVQNLRDASERNTKAIEQLRKRVPELTAADTRISERLRELESGRARLIRTVTFANDLKPKVASIKRDLGAFEPQLSDLTLRIGRLAEDLMKREQEVAELRQTLANLTAVEGDLSVTAKQVSEIADISDIGAMHRPT